MSLKEIAMQQISTAAEAQTTTGLVFRKWYAFSEETVTTELGAAADGDTLWKHAVAVVVQNPYAGRFTKDLSLLVEPSVKLGGEMAGRLLALCGSRTIEGYGKAAVVGVEGEYEHGNALLTTAFADPIRDMIGGAKAWIPSTGKRGGPGTTIDVPLAHKDALYVRSHYDTCSLSFSDAPGPREIAAIFAVATRGRLHARLGGLTAGDVIGDDGLR
jgi:hypothetical protein